MANKAAASLISDLRRSLAWMDLVLANLSEGVVVIGKDMKIMFANDAMAELVGKPRIFLLGRQLGDVAPLKPYQTAESPVKKRQSTKGVSSLRGEYLLEGPSPRVVEVTSAQIERSAQVVVVIHEITEQKHVEESLRQHNQQLSVEKAKDEAFLQAIGDALVVTDKEGHIVLVNAAFEQLLGWKRREVIGKSFVEIAPMLDEAGNLITRESRPLAKALKTRKKVMSSNLSFIRRNGTNFPAELTNAPIIMDREVAGTVTVFRDITERLKLEEQQRDFVSIASHELRTPITALKGYAAMALQETGPDQTNLRTFTSRTMLAADRLGELVEDLLTITRIEENRLPRNLNPIHLGEMIERIMVSMQPDIHQKGHQIEFSNKLSDKDYVEGDPSLVEQIFVNLLSNAVKYTPDNGIIQLNLDKTAKTVCVRIHDNGIGISKENLSRIYDKFFREESTLTPQTQGTGLGLYITKRLVEHHDATLKIERGPKEGTHAFVEFPRLVKPRD